MTKCVLVSGCLSHYRDQILAYTKEIFSDTDSKVNVLWCMFATSKAQEETKYQNYRTLYDPYFNQNREVEHTLASEECFVEEVHWADVIIIHGGGNKRLRKMLQAVDLSKTFRDKIIVAHSSAANYLAAAAWSPGGRKVIEGRGVVPVKLITHYRSSTNEDERAPTDWDVVVKAVGEFGDTSLPVWTLRDGTFKTWPEKSPT